MNFQNNALVDNELALQAEFKPPENPKHQKVGSHNDRTNFHNLTEHFRLRGLLLLYCGLHVLWTKVFVL